MRKERRRPSWWQLWLLLPALGILAFLEARAPLSPAGHTRRRGGNHPASSMGWCLCGCAPTRSALLRESRDGLSQTTVDDGGRSTLGARHHRREQRQWASRTGMVRSRA